MKTLYLEFGATRDHKILTGVKEAGISIDQAIDEYIFPDEFESQEEV